MKLGTLRTASPDGELIVVSRDFTRMARATDIAPTLQAALDRWTDTAPRLAQRYDALNRGQTGESFDPRRAHSPLPRAYQWCDGSVYEAHIDADGELAQYHVGPALLRGAMDVPGRVRWVPRTD